MQQIVLDRPAHSKAEDDFVTAAERGRGGREKATKEGNEGGASERGVQEWAPMLQGNGRQAKRMPLRPTRGSLIRRVCEGSGAHQ